ncbi:MAG: S8 family serine peptidase [Myxococcota bacterium]
MKRHPAMVLRASVDPRARAAWLLLLAGLAATTMPGRRPHGTAAAAPGAPPAYQRVLVHLNRTADPAAVDGLFEVAPGIAAGWATAAQRASWRAAGLRVEPSVPLRPSLDAARATLGVDAVRADLGLTGAGVVVGVIDTGFDVTHPTFRRADGSSRVAWLLTDGDPAGLHPELEARFGCTGDGPAPCAIYAGADIDALVAAGSLPEPWLDQIGHGTHVTSLAAGHGDLDDPMRRYEGVAPDADLVLVMQSSAAYVDQVLNGARFIFDRAEARGAPTVINLSSGYHGGPHDGSSALAAGLAAFLEGDPPGRGIVVAAGNDGALVGDGNDGALGIHTSVELQPDIDCPVVLLTVDDPPVDLWLRHRADRPLTIGVQGPDGTTWLAPTADDATATTPDGLTLTLDAARPGLEETYAHAWLRFEGTAWTWGTEIQLMLRGEGYVDAWAHSVLDYTLAHALFRQPTAESTVDIPAVHPRLIAVGASVNRSDWPSRFGTPRLAPTPTGDVPIYSAWGPGAGGALKPELVAPGDHVVGAVGFDARPSESLFSDFGRFNRCDPPFSSCALVDDDYGVLAGTSMAAPLVAGVAALLFEADPTLTQTALREALLGAASPVVGDAASGQTGAGVVDAARALELIDDTAARGGGGVDVAQSGWRASRSYLRVADPTPVVVHLRDADGRPAAEVDPARLEATGDGLLVTDPRRLGAATLAFDVAAADRTRPERTLAVRYDGTPIFTTDGAADATLPVGLPPRLCGAPPLPPLDVSPGCTCRFAGSAPGVSLAQKEAWSGLILLLGLALRGRRRASR